MDRAVHRVTVRFFRAPIPWTALEQETGIVAPEKIDAPEPKYNIAPGSWLPVIRIATHGEPRPEMALMLWGLVPQWWSQPLSEKRWSSFNARSEDAADAPAFRGALRYRRCLVPASGFFLWSGAKDRRTPFAIGLIDRPWFCFAGVWECWGQDGSEIDTLAILTVPANDLVAAHSDRMPVIIPAADHERWMREGPADRTLLKPYPSAAMREWPVGPEIGNVRNQGPHLIA